jgi:hypothetical protein
MKRRLRATLFMAFALPLGISAALGFGPGVASALGHVDLGSHSQKDIEDHCGAAGGTSVDSDGVYGCWGSGGDVTCSKQTKTCYGTCEKCDDYAIRGSASLDEVTGRHEVEGTPPAEGTPPPPPAGTPPVVHPFGSSP